MKANVTNLRETSKVGGRKENGFHREIAVLDPKTGRAIVTARIYWPGETAYCALWIGNGNAYGRGQGKAGGYGYHKPSAALQDAISDAGVTLSGDVYGRDPKSTKPARISGVGDSAMEAACEAIAKALTGKRRFIVHVAHA